MDLASALDFIRPRNQGVVVALKADGRPQLSNIAYALGDDGLVRISVTDSRAKVRNARRDPRVSLYVGAPDFGSYVVVEGDADLSPVADDVDDATVAELVDLYRSVVGEHPDWDDYRAAMVADHRMVLRLRPTRAYGMAPSA
ncbi:PPOX class F420-dependent oxidoreductase [soil metagenome]